MEPSTRTAQFSFTGTASEYFKIWIVNVGLSILTLGIYSAWAKVRTRRYFYGNTVVDGHRFDFHGNPVRILKGRALAVAALAVYFGVWQFYPAAGFYALVAAVAAVPAVVVMAASFNLRNTSHRNIRFGFRGKPSALYRAALPPLAIVLLIVWIAYAATHGSDWARTMETMDDGWTPADMLPTYLMLAVLPLLPYLDSVRMKFLVDHASYGSMPLRFGTGARAFYWLYAGAAMLMVGVMLVAFAGSAIIGLVAAAIDADFGLVGLLVVLVVYSMMFIVSGYLRARRTNLIYNNVEGQACRIQSSLAARDVSWLYFSNTVAIVFTLGMLIPWAKVRMAKYVAARSKLEILDVEAVLGATNEEANTIGEELGDMFGFDYGF